MINRTIKKLKETSEAIASIVKSFASIIASAIACVTVSITGYIEIKKLTVTALKTRKESKEEIANLRSNHPSIPISRTKTAEIVAMAPIPQETYKVDANTGIFALAVIALPLIWYMGRKKKEEKL